MDRIATLTAAIAIVAAVALAGCDPAPSPRPSPTRAADKPAIQIDQNWQAANGRWTFTGHVHPRGESTDVVLEIGPGPATLRQFDTQKPVAQHLLDAGPLSITTADIPNIAIVCVRFTATSSGGVSSSSPLCFPHDLPSFIADVVPPTVTFSAPAFGATTVLSGPTYGVAWTEVDEGSGVASRSLQRQVAPLTAGTCGSFADDGPASTSESPVAVADLLDGHCYQWLAKLRDAAGNTSETTSGIVRVDAGHS